jgi:hypothetical protein
MRTLCIIMIFLCAWLSGAAASAQEGQRWYYGWKPESGQLFAYTPEGEVRVLLESGIADEHSAIRIDEQHAVGVFTLNGDDNRSVLYLTPDEAQPLVPSFDTNTFEADSPEYTLRAFTDDYALLMNSPRIPGDYGFIANFNAETIEALSEFTISSFLQQARFSEDGQYLRYIGYTSESQEAWSLRERTLATGDERVLFSDEKFPTVVSDTFGEHWLIGLRTEAGWQYNRLDTNGQSEVITEVNEENRLDVRAFGDYLYLRDMNCTENCTITVTPAAGGDDQTFVALPSDNFLNPLALVNGDRLLVLNLEDDTYYTLSENQPPLPIGLYTPQNIPQPISDTLSPDGRFLLTVFENDDDMSFGVWDFSRDAFVVEQTPEQFAFPFVFYGENGFLVSQGLTEFSIYDANTDSIAKIPSQAGVCFALLPDNDALCTVSQRDQSLEPGIYRYNPDDESFALLVENGMHLIG